MHVQQHSLSPYVHPGTCVTHHIICSVLTQASRVIMIKSLMVSGNKHTLCDVALISRTTLSPCHKPQVSHVDCVSSLCTQYDTHQREIFFPQGFHSCSWRHVMWTWVRGSYGGETKSDTRVFVDSKSATSESNSEIGAGQRSWRSWDWAISTGLLILQSSYTACSTAEVTAPESPSASEEDDNEQSMPDTLTAASNFMADNAFLPSTQCRMYLCRQPQGKEGWWQSAIQ